MLTNLQSLPTASSLNLSPDLYSVPQPQYICRSQSLTTASQIPFSVSLHAVPESVKHNKSPPGGLVPCRTSETFKLQRWTCTEEHLSLLAGAAPLHPAGLPIRQGMSARTEDITGLSERVVRLTDTLPCCLTTARQ
ncbi:hypothetical protein E2C01_060285 [Portunus trituberculatus]|uniref:Uncharacterized protein n=1 Tax=Portunus trituberculatus TaxID=210409 RepID=A0A5B7H1U5_PORTR|nr:hypothetical protein [Portunus trituberculatus]